MREIRSKINKILGEAKRDYDINDKIKVVIRPMKVKAASVSLNKGIVRLNKNLIDSEDDGLLKYLIYHELAHYKIKSKYHTQEFYKLLYSEMKEEDVKSAEDKIIKKFLSIKD